MRWECPRLKATLNPVTGVLRTRETEGELRHQQGEDRGRDGGDVLQLGSLWEEPALPTPDFRILPSGMCAVTAVLSHPVWGSPWALEPRGLR